MSLELIDRFLESWEDPNYEGMIEQMSYLKHVTWSLDTDINEKLVKDIEQVRFLRPSLLKMSEYPRNKEGLLKFYNDHNFVQGNPRYIKHAYAMNPFPEQEELDSINKYLTDKTKYIMQIGFGEGLLSLNFLENSKAYLVTFAYFRQEYGFYGKMFLESLFPGRHMLIMGIPQLTIPSFSFDKEPHVKFDMISYAGSRRYNEVYNTILYCRKYAHENTIINLGFVCPHLGHGVGIYVGMNKLIKDGIVEFIEHVKIPGFYGDYSNGIAFLKYKMDESEPTKLNPKIYKSIEINIPLYEFTNYIIDNHRKSVELDVNIIKAYIIKLNKAGIELDDYLKKYLKENYELE